jgi:tRNA (mo5U34)-methyltransferase
VQNENVMLKIDNLQSKSLMFKAEIDSLKARIDSTFPWYPWGTLYNFAHLQRLLTGDARDLARLVRGLPVADVGAADGELSFYLERMGLVCDIMDFAPTNMNGLRGAKLLKEELSSKVEIFDIDLDRGFEWPRKHYGLTFFLGILYHLKNPFLVLESMAKVSEYALVSTRIARYTPDKKISLETIPAAYLLHASEANNDATNYWIFSDAGLKRIFDRSGWNIIDYLRLGNTKNSDPASNEGDERAFALVKSRYF